MQVYISKVIHGPTISNSFRLWTSVQSRVTILVHPLAIYKAVLGKETHAIKKAPSARAGAGFNKNQNKLAAGIERQSQAERFLPRCSLRAPE